jgi:hypothetical protein
MVQNHLQSDGWPTVIDVIRKESKLNLATKGLKVILSQKT